MNPYKQTNKLARELDSGPINMMMDKHKLGNSNVVKSMIPFFQGGIDNSPTEYEHK